MYFSYLAGCLLAALLHPAVANLPAELKGCKKSSNDYQGCLSTQMTAAVNLFKNGYRKFGLLPLEPLRFTSMLIDQGQGPVAIRLLLSDVDFYGLSDLKVVNIRNDWKIMEFDVYCDNVTLVGHYKINGKVLVLPIQGDGDFQFVFSNLTVGVSMHFDTKKKNGKEYFKVTDFQTDLRPKRVSYRFENLFNGDKALGENMNTFLNENWSDILNELKPAISKALSAGFLDITNRVFSHLPTHQIDIQ